MILSCGHEPTPDAAPGTGKARTAEGEEICYDCANARERADFNVSERYGAYLNGGASQVQTWPGGFLANVTRTTHHRHMTPSGALYERWHVWAVGDHGVRWYGTGPGPGMYVRLRRLK